MKQSRLESLIESSLNTASGFVVAMLIMQFIITPLWNLPTTSSDNLAITLVFTVAAITRSYLWRRFFNAGIHKRVHQLCTLQTGTSKYMPHQGAKETAKRRGENK